jgi:MFS family permease
VPILLSASTSPPFDPPERMALRELLATSPMALMGCFLNGIAQAALYVGLGLYGSAAGLRSGAVGALVGAMTLGGMLLQFPLGRLSDRIDRRLVIVGVAFAGVGISLLLMVLEPSRGTLLYPAVGLLGGLVLPIYAVCIAQANDRLKPGQIVAASGTLVLLLNAGIVLGPVLSAAAITTFGPKGLFLLLVVVQGATALVGVSRLLGRRASVEEQGVAPAVSQYGTPVAARLNPEAEEMAPAEAGTGR